MKQILLSLYIIFIPIACFSQGYVKMTLTKEEKQRGIVSHYQKDATDGHYMVFDIFLYKNGSFYYSRSDNLHTEYSVGRWHKKGNQLTLESKIQENRLPIKIEYFSAESFGKRRIAQIRNLKEEVTEAKVFINVDSVDCFYGDNLCIGTWDTIRRVKVGIEYSPIQSQWLQVKPGNETIQIIIDTELDLKRYTVYNKSFWIRKDQLQE